MLYKFKSRAASDLIMLEPHARRLLEIMDKEPGPTGIILASQMADAMAVLEAAVRDEEYRYKQALEAAQAQGEPPPPKPEVSLRQRSAPMLEMLRRSKSAGYDIVWGV